MPANPTKQKVRDWQAKRLKEHTPPPSIEQIKRELGWDIEEAKRKARKPK